MTSDSLLNKGKSDKTQIDGGTKILSNVVWSAGILTDFIVSLMVITLSFVKINLTNSLTYFGDNRAFEIGLTTVDASNAFWATVAMHFAESKTWSQDFGLNLREALRLPWLLKTANGLLTNEGPELVRIGRSLLSDIRVTAIAVIVVGIVIYVEQVMFWKKKVSALLRERPESRLISSWWRSFNSATQ